LPVSCLPALRLPLAAPFLSLLGGEGARLFARLLRRESFVQIRLAGVDLLDPAEAPEGLRARRRDLTIPLAARLSTLEAALDALSEGAEVATLEEAARRLVASGL